MGDTKATRKRLKANWHDVVTDILGILSAAGNGLLLERKIKEFKANGKTYELVLTCVTCGTGMLFGLDKLYANHLDPKANPPPIACPSCKDQGDHYYEGVQ